MVMPKRTVRRRRATKARQRKTTKMAEIKIRRAEAVVVEEERQPMAKRRRARMVMITRKVADASLESDSMTIFRLMSSLR